MSDPVWPPESADGRETDAAEIEISPEEDGRERAFVTVWFVTVGSEVFVRNGAGWGEPSAWIRRAVRLRRGRARLAGTSYLVALEPVDADDPVQPRIDEAYLAKYRSGSMSGEPNRSRTIRVFPLRSIDG